MAIISFGVMIVSTKAKGADTQEVPASYIYMYIYIYATPPPKDPPFLV